MDFCRPFRTVFVLDVEPGRCAGLFSDFPSEQYNFPPIFMDIFLRVNRIQIVWQKYLIYKLAIVGHVGKLANAGRKTAPAPVRQK
jgi:hypothetical protein